MDRRTFCLTEESYVASWNHKIPCVKLHIRFCIIESECVESKLTSKYNILHECARDLYAAKRFCLNWAFNLDISTCKPSIIVIYLDKQNFSDKFIYSLNLDACYAYANGVEANSCDCLKS